MTPHGGALGWPRKARGEETGRVRRPSANRAKRARGNTFEESNYDTEYTTGGETNTDNYKDLWER